ncbi:LiaI-LiaF-like domain-containing protein [Spirosoma rhododendri]|uniref:LiaI-LiaF-like transmembrane region domain-containing protein n=1 Tax=Spirosoma rhododendri TaxID=2728024 RepID=A0A7L5DQT4_9BACT|nr:DUF5668 domain-containing protein [Spirosoma rhododendri]QJD79962.1 hypothetical protein HH216_17245 [Spirosoma rhododendri]
MYQRRNGLFWGIALLTLGVLFLARRAGWLNVDWHSLTNLWPVLLILAGINLILIRTRNPAAFITTVMLAVAVPTTLFGFFSRDHSRYNIGWSSSDDHDQEEDENDEDEDDTDDEDNEDNDNEDDYRAERDRRGDGEMHSSTFTEAMSPDTREAVLKLAGGAGQFNIGEPSSELIKADTKQTVGTYSMSVERDPATRIPTVELKPTDGNQHIELKDGNFENRVDVHLNTAPVWTMDIALGAGQGELDLSQYAVKSLKVAAGAASLDVKLSDKADQSDVKLDVGAASVTVRVPEGVGCRVKKDGALTSENLDGFTETGGGEFLSPGYEASTKKITIRFDGGLSSLKVVRY